MPEFSSSSEASQEKPTGDIDGVNTKFYLKYSPVINTESIYKNGMFMTRGADYVINGKEVTFTDAPIAGSTISVNYKYGRDQA
jgi:hypothetical protein